MFVQMHMLYVCTNNQRYEPYFCTNNQRYEPWLPNLATLYVPWLPNLATLPPRFAGTVAKMNNQAPASFTDSVVNMNNPANLHTTGRAKAAAGKTTYAEPTCAGYEAMLDDTTPSPTFNQALAEAHSYLQSAYDALIAKNKFNALHADAGSVEATAAQQQKVVMALHAWMKETLCLAFLTDDMSDKRVCADMLTNTSFVGMGRIMAPKKETGDCKVCNLEKPAGQFTRAQRQGENYSSRLSSGEWSRF